MSMSYVRRFYDVPAKRGGRITLNGRPGVITSATHYLRVRFDGSKASARVHPADEGLLYLEEITG